MSVCVYVIINFRTNKLIINFNVAVAPVNSLDYINNIFYCDSCKLHTGSMFLVCCVCVCHLRFASYVACIACSVVTYTEIIDEIKSNTNVRL